MSVQASAFDLQPFLVTTNAWRSRTLAVILMIAIAGIFWVDSRYPALLKRYRAGTQVKAAGTLTFGTVYSVDRTMPLSTRVWRTTVNWLDANRIGMTFSFLFGPAALTFLATLRRRRTNSVYLNTLFGAAAGMPLAVCTNCVAPIARGFYASGIAEQEAPHRSEREQRRDQERHDPQAHEPRYPAPACHAGESLIRCRDQTPGEGYALGFIAIEESAACTPLQNGGEFQARFTASPMPVFMPCPPTGLWMCAASPSRKARPLRN